MDKCVVTNKNDISTRINPNTRWGDGVEDEIGIFFVLLNFVEKTVGHRSMCVCVCLPHGTDDILMVGTVYGDGGGITTRVDARVLSGCCFCCCKKKKKTEKYKTIL